MTGPLLPYQPERHAPENVRTVLGHDPWPWVVNMGVRIDGQAGCLRFLVELPFLPAALKNTVRIRRGRFCTGSAADAQLDAIRACSWLAAAAAQGLQLRGDAMAVREMILARLERPTERARKRALEQALQLVLPRCAPLFFGRWCALSAHQDLRRESTTVQVVDVGKLDLGGSLQRRDHHNGTAVLLDALQGPVFVDDFHVGHVVSTSSPPVVSSVL